MDTSAVLLLGPRDLTLDRLALTAPGPEDVVVEVSHSAISSGTEKLLWSGDMPTFPGMGYPLVPGYEAVGEVVEAGRSSGFRSGERVFVPGSNGFADARGLFGASARHLVTPASRVSRLDAQLGEQGVLLALTATALHALQGSEATPPELIVGHGVLGRLLARISIVLNGVAPTVWDIDSTRLASADGYDVVHPDTDERRDYASVFEASGSATALNDLIPRIQKGGEIVLAGFYAEPLSFAYPPAFMKEARIRVAAEWTPNDMTAAIALVETGMLSLDGLITHTRPAAEAPDAYAMAFDDPNCLKMSLDWSDAA